MKLPLQITFRDLVPLPSLEPEIRRRVDKLQQWGVELMSCHVMVSATGNQHRKGHVYTVQLDVRVPGQEIVVGDHHSDTEIYRAVAGAFDAADRAMEDHARRRRGQVKHHAEAQDPEPDS
jgi:ribosome-associated translation inhibitor RaiA